MLNHAYPTAAAESLLTQGAAVRAHVEPWRSKRVAHHDADVALGRASVGQVVPSQLERFYKVAGQFLEVVSQALGLGPCPIDTVPYYGAGDLVRALKQAAVVDVLEQSPIKRHEVLVASKYAGA